MRAAVVVPTNRPERIIQFIEAWEPQFHRDNVRLLVVEDADTPMPLPEWVEHYHRGCIAQYLGDKANCIPTRSGGIRNFGFWLACLDTTIDMIVSLDDDVLPLDGVDFLGEHWRMMETPRPVRWWPVLGDLKLRGFPHGEKVGRKPVLNHGLWQGFPDVDALTQMSEEDCPSLLEQANRTVPYSMVIPKGCYYTQCGMNVAFRRDIAPFMYFPKLPDGMRRFDDIWCGVILKRIADLFGWVVTSGQPMLRHDRASNPLANLRQEWLGYGLNETFWQTVDRVPKAGSPLSTYRDIAVTLASTYPQLEETARHMRTWAGLFS